METIVQNAQQIVLHVFRLLNAIIVWKHFTQTPPQMCVYQTALLDIMQTKKVEFAWFVLLNVKLVSTTITLALHVKISLSEVSQHTHTYLEVLVQIDALISSTFKIIPTDLVMPAIHSAKFV